MTESVSNRQIAEAAAEWAIRIDAGPLDAAQRDALARWLKASPAHVDELLYCAAILGGLESVDRERKLAIEEDLSSPRSEVIPLFATAPATASGTPLAGGPPRPKQRILSKYWAIAASVALFVAAALALAHFGAAPGEKSSQMLAVQSYATDLGEQRSVTLADGSVVSLNTDSQLRVRLSEGERRLDLVRGEALFDVARDPLRPFRVYAGGAVAQAVGTKFNVRHTGTGVRVVVFEGKVLVDDPDALADDARPAPAAERHAREVLLLAGQQADLGTPSGAPRIAEADMVAASSWRLRQLSFDDAGLDEIVAEFNRYNRVPIVLADPSLSAVRFSGVFDANDPKSFVAFLELSTSIKVDRSQSDRIVLRRQRR